MKIGLGGQITVTATERWLSEIRGGRAFSLGADLGASVGNFGHIQLLNPAGSARTIIVRAAHGAAGAAINIAVRTSAVVLATLIGAGVNLLVGAVAGLGVIRQEALAAETGTLTGILSVPANDSRPFVTEWYVELDPGEGVLINGRTINTLVSAFYQWIELP
jgi:hypothetical protein